MAITNIEICPEWFYHAITPVKFSKIIHCGEIQSKRLMTPEEKITVSNINTSNGLYYISLAKNEKCSIYDSSYLHFIKNRFALILNVPHAKKAHYITNFTFYSMTHMLRTLDFPIRFSPWKDEYQAKGVIPLRQFVGIKIPANSSELARERGVQQIDSIIQVMEDNQTYLPFFDLGKQKKIDAFDIKEYIKNR
ncbi:MAG: hypothetical protein HFG40_03420 [Bacilli bacterium]|nr:hypothetical protein [Bacilli bacterium]